MASTACFIVDCSERFVRSCCSYIESTKIRMRYFVFLPFLRMTILSVFAYSMYSNAKSRIEMKQSNMKRNCIDSKLESS